MNEQKIRLCDSDRKAECGKIHTYESDHRPEDCDHFNKPQTTRNRIQTVYTSEEGQVVFLDTPGIHKAKNKLGEYMVNVAERTLKDVDVILWLVEPTNFIGAGSGISLCSFPAAKCRLFWSSIKWIL